MAGERKLTVVIDGESGKAKTAFNDVEKSAGGMGSKVGAAGALVAGAFVAAGAAAVGFGVKAVMAGSDLNETMSKSNAVFKDSAGAIEQWSKSSATSFGMSKQEAVDAASTFGNLFVQLGTGSGEAAKMSQQMTELAADFGSFHNASNPEVIEAMTAAFRGEYDAVQRFVPTINAAAVEQKALEMSGKSATKELTAQEKALATQKLLLEGAGDAMGDFDRTNDSLANRLKTVQSRAADFTAEVGTRLLPVVLGAFDAFETIGPKVARGFDVVKNIITDFASGDVASAGVSIGALLGLEEDSEGTNTIITYLETVREVIAGAIDFVKEKFGEIRDWVAVIMPEIQATVAVVIGWIQEGWRLFGDDILNVAQGIWTAISGVISGVLDVIMGLIRTVMAIIRGDWGAAWEGIKQIFSGIWEAIKGIVMGALQIVSGWIGAAWQMIKEATSNAWNSITEKIRGVWHDIYTAVQERIDKIKYYIDQTWTKVKEITSSAWENLKLGVTTTIDSVVGFVKGIPGRVTEGLGKLGSTLLSSGKDLIQGFIDGIKEKASSIVNVIKDAVTDKIPGFVKDKLGIKSPSRVFMALGREVPAGFAAGIAQTTALVDRAMENMVPSASFAGGRVGSAGAGGSSTSSTRNFYGGITVVANDSRSFFDELADRESLALPLHVA